MALQMVVVATLLFPSHGISPILAGLACSFLFKLSFNITLLRQACVDICHGIRILMYQIGQIAFVTNGGGRGGNPRWQQALQALCGRVINARRSHASIETSFHALTMLSL
ncbi:hypothetical protein COLO4_37180 [Corchorus olitorius]|uniref:Secreted protein n=1 Tax=Corchorus olitorius TaxID=93759 RepID=A0A1R3G300_9ROSI|nr:hypothetical protein COLO4_37180 [Corchorus olitorius]